MRRMGESTPKSGTGFSGSLLAALVFLGLLAVGYQSSVRLERAVVGERRDSARVADQPSQIDRELLDLIIQGAIGETK